jgi:hypothetical protein
MDKRHCFNFHLNSFVIALLLAIVIDLFNLPLGLQQAMAENG